MAKLIFLANVDYLMEKLNEDSILKKILKDAVKKHKIVKSNEFFGFLKTDKKKSDARIKLKSLIYPAFYNEYDFYEYFRNDLTKAENKVIISSPFLTVNRITQFEQLFRKMAARNVKTFIITKPFMEQEISKDLVRELKENLKKFNIELKEKKLSHEKFAIIDGKIIWHGSLNILSHKNTSELMIRFQTKTDYLSQGILKLCGINIEDVQRVSEIREKINDLNKKGFGRCPCGGKMLLRYGSGGPFLSCERFPKCRESRDVDASILVKIYGENYFVCEKCGSAMVVKFNRKRRSRFLGCSKYPECRFTRPL